MQPSYLSDQHNNPIENVIVVREAVGQLPPPQRAILSLKYAGYKFNEISELLNITRNSVSTNFSKAVHLVGLSIITLQ